MLDYRELNLGVVRGAQKPWYEGGLAVGQRLRTCRRRRLILAGRTRGVILEAGWCDLGLGESRFILDEGVGLSWEK